MRTSNALTQDEAKTSEAAGEPASASRRDQGHGPDGAAPRRAPRVGSATSGSASAASASASSVTRALRTVYDETLREDVPDDFLRLLGKLD
jgi:hypothetical protein